MQIVTVQRCYPKNENSRFLFYF